MVDITVNKPLRTVILTDVDMKPSATGWEVLVMDNWEYDAKNNLVFVTYRRVVHNASSEVAFEIATNHLVDMFPHDWYLARGYGENDMRAVEHPSSEKPNGQVWPVMFVRWTRELNHNRATFRWNGTTLQEL